MTTIERSNFADMFQLRRREKHLSLRALAEATGWSVAYLSQIGNGSKRPPLPGWQTDILAELLGIPKEGMQIICLLGRKSVDINIDDLPYQHRLLAITVSMCLPIMTENEVVDMMDKLIARHADDEDEAAI